MPSPAEIEQSALEQLALPEPGALTTFGPPPEPEGPGLLEQLGGFATGAFDVGAGGLVSFFEFLDKISGRPIRQVLGGRPGEALSSILEAVLPGTSLEALGLPNLEQFVTRDVLGLPESRPFSGRDLLVQGGFQRPQDPSAGFEFGAEAAGFGVEAVLDPLTLFGAPLGRLVSRALRRISGTVARANAVVARAEIPALSGLARGAEAAGRGIGDAFIKDFGLKRGIREGVRARGGTLVEADAAVARSLAERDAFRRNAASMELQAASIGGRVVDLVGADERAQLFRLREIPQFEQQFLIKRVGADPAQLGFPTTSSALEELAQQRLRVGVTDEVVEEVINDLSEDSAQALKLMLTGDPSFANLHRVLPGTRGAAGAVEDIRRSKPNATLGREEQLVDLDHLQRDKMREMFERTGVAHVGRFTRRRELKNALEMELRDAMGTSARGIDSNTQLLSSARRLAALNKEGAAPLRLRKTIGLIDEVESQLGTQLFLDDAAEEFLLSSRRFIAVKTANDMGEWLLRNPDVATVSRGAPAVPRPGHVAIPLSDLPRGIRNRLEKGGVTHVSVQEQVAKEFFGTGGMLQGMIRFGEGQELFNALQKFNRLYKPWTLAHPGSITRDAVGDVFLNLIAGVTPNWYLPARKVYTAIKRRRTGKAVTGTIRLGGKNVPLSDVVDDLIDSGIPGHSLMHTEFYNIQNDIQQAGPLRRLFKIDPGQNTWVRTLMDAKGAISDHSRIAQFLKRRTGKAGYGTGEDLASATLNTKKFLYDADQLTNFERRVMREIFPFYSWARQNVPNMVRATLEGTAFSSAKFGALGPNIPFMIGRVKINLDAQMRADVPEELLPEWLQGQLTIPVGRDPDGQLSLFALNNWVPVADLTELDSPKKFVKFVFNSMTPLITEPVEQFFNMDAYFQRAIERYPGEREQFLGMPVQRRVAKVLRTARLLNELDRTFIPLANKIFGTEIGTGTQRLQDLLGQQEWQELAARAFAGAKIRDLDLVRAKKVLISRTRREIRGLKTKLKFARRDVDQANVRQIQSLMAKKRELLQTALGFQPTRHPQLSGLTDPEVLGLEAP